MNDVGMYCPQCKTGTDATVHLGFDGSIQFTCKQCKWTEIRFGLVTRN